MPTNKKNESIKPVEPVQPRVPLGKAIVRTDEELDEMCSPEAMEALMGEAAEDWEENAPPGFKGLLNAKGTKDGK